MSLFNNKLSKVPLGMLDQDVQDKFTGYDTSLAQIATQLSSRQAGETDDSPRLQRAINSLRLTGGTILLQDVSYTWASGITTYQNIKIKGFNTVVDCSSIPAGTPAIVVNGVYTGGTIRNGYLNVLEGVQLKGNATVSDNPVSYTTNSIGIEFAASHLKIKECSFTGFDKTTKFLTNSYIITFEECMFSYNNYGVHFDATGQSNLGEKIVFRGCTIGNNNYGIYNNLGELIFEHSSIDYNRTNHIADNITDNGGYASSVMQFNDCHFELTVAYNPSSNSRIVNHGRMVIKGGAIWDDSATTIFNNSGTIIIDGTLWRINEDGNYYHIGSGIIQVGKLIPISDDQNIRLIPALSGIQNHNFETGNTNGWTLGSGSSSSNITVTNTAGNVFKGTYSLSMTSASSSIGGEIDSSKVNIDPSKSFAQLSFYHKNASNLNVYIHLIFFDSTGNTLLDTYTTLNTNEASFSKSKISATIPNGSVSYQVKANIGANATGNCYLDEFFMRVA